MAPVITVVLYFGKTRWNGPRSLYEMLDIPEKAKKYVPDYPINIIEVAFLEEDTITKFKSDFRVIAEYFHESRLGGNTKEVYNRLKKSTKNWDHVEELMEFFRTFTGNRQFEDFRQFMVEKKLKGEDVNMTTLFDTIEKEIFNTVEKEIAEKNYALGVEAGILKEYKRLENLMKNKNWTAEEAMDTLGYSEDEKDAYRKWSLAEKKVSEKA